ncbi:MAG: NosD domain-containing protein [Candidatus Bathyarchaeia archaeon]
MTVTNTKIMTFFYAIYLNDSSYNEIRFNNLTNNMVGIHFESYSFYNSISGNNITNNELGIELAFSSKNRFFHNNIINNTQQVEIDPPNYVNYWDDGYPSGGNYWSDYTGEDLYGGPYQNETWSDCIGDTPYIINANNTDRYPLTKTKRAPAEIVLSKTIIGKGNSMPVNVTVVNKGDSTETFNVILYANTTAVNRTEVTLTSGSYAIITLTWNTSSFAKGNYTIRAYVWPALGETSIEDTTATYSVITVTIPGDGGCDGDIDIYDVVLITSIYGLKMGDANYNPNVDWLDDGIINIYDVVTATSRYGQKDP